MNKITVIALSSLAIFGCATTNQCEKKDVPAAKPAAPAKPADTYQDPNKYAGYGPAIKSTEGYKMAVEWQAENGAAIAEAVRPAVLKGCLASASEADALLGQVKEAYTSDPMVLTKIAAVTQLSMHPKSLPGERDIWVKALLRAAGNANDSYRKQFFLDQLRWCASAADKNAVLKIGADSKDPNVAEFSRMVARELK